jgi:hypothetical protein
MFSIVSIIGELKVRWHRDLPAVTKGRSRRALPVAWQVAYLLLGRDP